MRDNNRADSLHMNGRRDTMRCSAGKVIHYVDNYI
jgi:hypothetical protein